MILSIEQDAMITQMMSFHSSDFTNCYIMQSQALLTEEVNSKHPDSLITST